MANGLPPARIRSRQTPVQQPPVQPTKFDSATVRLSRRRVLSWALIAASGFPISGLAMASDPGQPAASPTTATTPASDQGTVEQAVLLDNPQPGDVMQTSGGLLGTLFSGDSDSKDDGRKAYPLPPPDPSSVDWSGVPYHRANPSLPPKSGPANVQPIRDPNRRSELAASAPSKPLSANAGGTVLRSAPSATAKPIAAKPSVTKPSATEQAELSSVKSSRRSGRRQLEPLAPEQALPSLPQRSSDLTAASESNVPQVARRVLAPQTVRPPARVSDLAGKEEAKSGAAATLPEIPRSLVDQPAKESKATASAVATPSPATPRPARDAVELPTIPRMSLDSAAERLAKKAPVAPEVVGETESKIERNSGTEGQRLAGSEQPGIRVVTEGPAEVLLRETTRYEVRVENRGSIDASGVVVRTSLPPWAEIEGHDASQGAVKSIDVEKDRQLEWSLDKLPAGSMERLFVRIKAVKPGTFDVATNWTTLPQTQTAEVVVREPKLVVEIDGPDEIVFGKSQSYRVRVLNPGDGTASNVVFSLTNGSGKAVRQELGNLPPGKESSFEVELTARDAADLKISGSAAADADLTATGEKTVSVVAAKLEAVLSGPAVKFQNTAATYQVQITNSGRASSESVVAEVRLPAGVRYLGGIEGARIVDDRLTWKVENLPAGDSRDYEFSCQMERTGDQQLVFNCSGGAGGQASVGLETVVQAIVDLKLSVMDPPAPAPVGSEVTYEVLINNRGSKAAENVRVVAQFGHGIEPLRVAGQPGEVVTGQAIFSPIARVEAGQQVKLQVIAKAEVAGDHRFRVEIRSGESVLVAEEATVFVDVQNQRISRSSSDPTAR